MERGRDSDREIEREKRRGWIEGETVTEMEREKRRGGSRRRYRCTGGIFFSISKMTRAS